MKIIQLSKFYKPYFGGVESVVADISEGLHCINKDVEVVACCKDGHSRNQLVDSVNVHYSKEWFSFSSTSFSLDYVRKVFDLCSRDNIFHVHLPNPLANFAILMAYLFKNREIRIIVHWHSDIIKQKKLLKLYAPLMNWLLEKAETIIVTSQRYLDASEQLSKFKNKCVVIPIGIDSISSLVCQDKVDSIKNLYKNKKIVFSLGRHIYYKGFEYLIESARDLDNAVVIIGGSGPDTEKYKQLIIDNGVSDKVFLIGRIEDSELPSYFAAADVFCFPSTEKSEAFGVVQLESMSVSTPVVSSEIIGSGVPWVNKNNVSGLIFEPKSVVALSKCLNIILTDDDLRADLSNGALSRFNSLFVKEKMISKINDVYEGKL